MDDFTAPDVPGFLVGRVLGRGGSSTVWLVTDERSGRDFALKCLGVKHGRSAHGIDVGLPDAAAEEDIRREIQILSVLDHQHLIRAHDAVRFTPKQGAAGSGEAGDGGIGLLLDYAPGGSLAELIASRRKLPVGETVTILTPIAQVLAYLHANGFTHGDVSPGNVLFTGHGKPLLADVGIARMVGDAVAVPDHGTAGFMDPAPVDAVRAGLQPERDVYSVAALGWYCLTGEPPRRTADRPPLSLLLPEVPPELAAALEAGLNEDRRLRPGAVELATAIYRSAPPLPVDLASSVHATVIPQLLTRRRIPDRPDGAVRNGLRAWRRRLSTSRWSGLTGARQLLPFPEGDDEFAARPRAARAVMRAKTTQMAGQATAARTAEVEKRALRGRHAVEPGAERRAPDFPARGPGPQASGPQAPGPQTPDAQRSGPGRPDPQRQGPQRRGGRAGRAANRRGTVLLSAAAAVVMAGAIWTAGAFGPGGPLEGLTRPGPRPAGTEVTDSTQNGSAVHMAGPAATGDADRGIPAAVAAQLGSIEPAEAVQGLAAVRSLAFSSGRLELLDLVNAPGSTAAAADAHLMDELQASGHLLAGFTSTVSNVQVQPGSSAGRAVVGVTSATSSYVEQDSSGQVVATAAPGAEQALRLVLVAVDGQWRIADVLPGS
ncbi:MULTISPECIES: protein kinase [unclassified Arthrobacter]|uniref:serine/threonine-protein kinase n=1 Tax=unclassified Arthrobacter TaxID=235627 RepID=UPI0033955F4E